MIQCKNKTELNITENRISDTDFINQLFSGDILRLEEILSVGLFLRKYFPRFLSEFLDCHFGTYIEMSDDYEDEACDIITEEFENLLDEQNKIYPKLTNVEVLNELLLECKLFDVCLIRQTIELRKKRLCNSKEKEEIM